MKQRLKRMALLALTIMPIASVSFAAKAALSVKQFSGADANTDDGGKGGSASHS